MIPTQRNIDLGTNPNDGQGASLRDGGDLINQNFTDLYASFGISEISVNIYTTVTTSSGGLILGIKESLSSAVNSSINEIEVGGNVVFSVPVGISNGRVLVSIYTFSKGLGLYGSGLLQTVPSDFTLINTLEGDLVNDANNLGSASSIQQSINNGLETYDISDGNLFKRTINGVVTTFAYIGSEASIGSGSGVSTLSSDYVVVETPTTSSSVEQNNTLPTITVPSVYSNGNSGISEALNNLPSFEVTETQTLHISNPYQIQTDTGVSFVIDSYFLALGKGTYGQGGVVITDNDLRSIGSNLQLRTANPTLPPPTDPTAGVVVYHIFTRDATLRDVQDIVNSEATEFTAIANQDVYFQITNIDPSVTFFPADEFNRRVFRYTGGDLSIGGEGVNSNTVVGDYVVLENEDIDLEDNFWSRAGNEGTDDTVDFIGTTDNQDVVFKSNNIELLRLTKNRGFQGGFNTTASGDFSTAFGANSTASGIVSTAFGDNTTASGDGSTAFGGGTEASGDRSTSFGSATTASGDRSTSFGDTTTASGDGSTAFGDTTTATGDRSTSFGSNTTASGLVSTAFGANGTEASGLVSTSFGSNTTASGIVSTAFGANGTEASGLVSTAFGNITTASGNASTSFGSNTISRSFSEASLGSFNTDYAPNSISQFNDSDRLFVLGAGTSNTNRRDAITTLKNSRTGFGYNNFETTTNTEVVQVNGNTLIEGDIIANTFTISSDTRVKYGFQPTGVFKNVNGNSVQVFSYYRTKDGTQELGIKAQDILQALSNLPSNVVDLIVKSNTGIDYNASLVAINNQFGTSSENMAEAFSDVQSILVEQSLASNGFDGVTYDEAVAEFMSFNNAIEQAFEAYSQTISSENEVVEFVNPLSIEDQEKLEKYKQCDFDCTKGFNDLMVIVEDILTINTSALQWFIE